MVEKILYSVGLCEQQHKTANLPFAGKRLFFSESRRQQCQKTFDQKSLLEGMKRLVSFKVVLLCSHGAKESVQETRVGRTDPQIFRRIFMQRIEEQKWPKFLAKKVRKCTSMFDIIDVSGKLSGKLTKETEEEAETRSSLPSSLLFTSLGDQKSLFGLLHSSSCEIQRDSSPSRVADYGLPFFRSLPFQAVILLEKKCVYDE